MKDKNQTKYYPSKDFILFPFRAFLLVEESIHGLTSLRDERFRYVKEYVVG